MDACDKEKVDMDTSEECMNSNEEHDGTGEWDSSSDGESVSCVESAGEKMSLGCLDE